MGIDYYDGACRLRVVNFYEPNETGWVTPRVLHDPALGVAPHLDAGGYTRFVTHGTAGRNTLAYWGAGGNGITAAQMLVPHESTVYRDGKVHDTTWAVFKIVPDDHTCNSIGECAAGFFNTNTYSVEHESMQDGTDDITDQMLLKSALIFAYDAAYWGIPDWYNQMHGIIAVNPIGRRSDPYAGRFHIARYWEHVLGIRRDARIWLKWGKPQPAGN